MTDFKVYRDETFDTVSTDEGLLLPEVLIPGEAVHERGALVYNTTDAALYYSDGVSWTELAIGGGFAGQSTRVHLTADLVALVNASAVIYDTIDGDPTNMYNASTGEFTVPNDGVYEVAATICANTFSAYPINFGVGILINSALPLHSASVRDLASAMPFFESQEIIKRLALSAGDTVTISFLAADGVAPAKTGTVKGAATTLSENTWASVTQVG